MKKKSKLTQRASAGGVENRPPPTPRPEPQVQSFSIPVGLFTIHPCIITGQLCNAGKGDSSVFCKKKEGYLRVCQATQRVDSTGERLYVDLDL